MTDQELIDAHNRGDARAFETLYRRYRDWVAGLALRFCGHHDDAMDVLQETFAYLVKKLPTLTLTSQMKTFLYPAVKNLSIRRRELARRHRTLESEPGSADSRDEGISHLLADLPDEQREVVLMRFADGLALREIADALEAPLGTVKSRLHAALNSLRERKIL